MTTQHLMMSLNEYKYNPPCKNVKNYLNQIRYILHIFVKNTVLACEYMYLKP